MLGHAAPLVLDYLTAFGTTGAVAVALGAALWPEWRRRKAMPSVSIDVDALNPTVFFLPWKDETDADAVVTGPHVIIRNERGKDVARDVEVHTRLTAGDSAQTILGRTTAFH